MIVFPYDIAAKLITNPKEVSKDEVVKFVLAARAINDHYQQLTRKVSELEQELKISEQTVKLLQVTDDCECRL